MLKLLLPKQFKELVTKRFAANHREWFAEVGAAGSAGSTAHKEPLWPMQISLGAPTEAQALPALAQLREWVGVWNRQSPLWAVATEERKWARLGAQTLPRYAVIASAEQAAELAGQGARWEIANKRAESLVQYWPQLTRTFLSKQFDVLADYSAEDFERLIGVLQWLQAHPHCNVYVRELPISGVDSKWAQGRQAVLASFLRAILGVAGDEDFYALTGLKRSIHRARLRLLCPTLRTQFSGLCDLEVPMEELARLNLKPKMLLIVENQATGLSLPDMPGVIVIMQMGLSAGALASVAWMQDVPALYWGDLDTYGFACLNRARAALPLVESILMDESTLIAHKELWVTEDKQTSDIALDQLTEQEQAVYLGLKAQAWGPNVRLEQERLLWPEVLSALWAGHVRCVSG